MEKIGYLVYDFIQDRYDICYNIEDYHGGLHCGDCFQVKVNNQWVNTRIELNQNGWYLVGIDRCNLYGLQVKVKTNHKVYRL